MPRTSVSQHTKGKAERPCRNKEALIITKTYHREIKSQVSSTSKLRDFISLLVLILCRNYQGKSIFILFFCPLEADQ